MYIYTHFIYVYGLGLCLFVSNERRKTGKLIKLNFLVSLLPVVVVVVVLVKGKSFCENFAFFRISFTREISL